MGRYTGPKARINRRFGAQLYESAGALRAYEKRSEQPPGMHPKARRTSNYGTALSEKQKIKYFYGLGERQLRRYFDEAVRRKGNTGETLLLICERRLDNIIRRVGLAKTRPQARQGIAHGHFIINGVKVSSPSFMVRPGDVIEIRANEAIRNLYRGIIANNSPVPLDWVSLDSEGLKATVLGQPGPSDISLPVNANIVVEFLSR
jgi:small subunit ribosomal protein S4